MLIPKNRSLVWTLVLLLSGTILTTMIPGCRRAPDPTGGMLSEASYESFEDGFSKEPSSDDVASSMSSSLKESEGEESKHMSDPTSKPFSSSTAPSSPSSPDTVSRPSDGQLGFTAQENGIYEIILDLPYSDRFTEQYKDLSWTIDDSFAIPFVASVKSGTRTLLGCLYLKKGSHVFALSAGDKAIPGEMKTPKVSFVPTEVYYYPRLERSEAWMRTLYEPDFDGYVEAEGWEDMWTHCQYLPEKFLYARLSGSTDLIAHARNAADAFIIGKMIQENGAAHTVYRARKDVYEESIESNMKQGVWDLWRGNAAAIEEMLNCYQEFGDAAYLQYARRCADYVLASWPVIEVEGTGPIYTDLTDGLRLQTQSVGRIVMVMCQLYKITGENRYRDAAIAQGKGILRSQWDNGLFYSEITAQWQHGNAFANAMLALGWLYDMTGDKVYRDAIAKAFEGYETAWTDDYGSLRLSGTNRETGMSTYLAGRMAQGLFTCAAFTGELRYYRTAEKTLYYAFGRNILRRDMQHETLGSYYYQLNYSGASNVETSSEMNLGLLQLYYLKTYWLD
jgi:hypothetical protein